MYRITSQERVQRHIYRAFARAIYHIAMQRLLLLEEEVLVVWAKQLYGWGWLARVAYLRAIAIKLLAEKGDKEKLRENWHLKFLGRYPNFQSKFAILRDCKRYHAQTPEIINHQFKLYDKIKRKYEVDDDNVYNFDKKGVMQGVARKMEILILKIEKNLYYTQLGNRE